MDDDKPRRQSNTGFSRSQPQRLVAQRREYLPAGGPGRRNGRRNGQCNRRSVAFSAYLVGVLRRCGKRSRADARVREAREILRAGGIRRPERARRRAVDRLRPRVETRSEVRAGVLRSLPVAISEERRQGLALRALRDVLRRREGSGRRPRAGVRLAREIRAILRGGGSARAWRQQRHRAALAQRSNLRG